MIARTQKKESSIRFSRAEFEEKIVAEAKAWIGTPHQHNCAVRAKEGRIGGVDCKFFLIKVFEALGFHVPSSFQRTMSPYWASDAQREIYLEAMLRSGRLVPHPYTLPGDVYVYRIGNVIAEHGALYVGDHTIIHSVQDYGVIKSDTKDGFWSLHGGRFVAAIRLYLVEEALGEWEPQDSFLDSI